MAITRRALFDRDVIVALYAGRPADTAILADDIKPYYAADARPSDVRNCPTAPKHATLLHGVRYRRTDGRTTS